MLLNYHIGRLVLSSLCVGDFLRLVLGGVSFAGCSCAYHIGRLVLSSLCVGDLVRLVLCGVRFAG